MEVIQLLTSMCYVTGVIINEKWFHRRPQNRGEGQISGFDSSLSEENTKQNNPKSMYQLFVQMTNFF